MAGNNNYQVLDYTTYSIAQVLKRDWTHQITNLSALLALIKEGKTNWNKGFQIEKGKRAAILPLIFAAPTQGAYGVTDANELVSDTLYITNGFTQAEFPFTHYRSSISMRNSEMRFAQGGQLGNFMDGKVAQITADFRRQVNADLEGTGTGSRSALLSTEAVLQTTNTIGGIDQTANTWWRGNRTNVAGPLSLPVIDSGRNLALSLLDGVGNTAKPDILLCSFASGGVDTYGRLHSLIAPAERIVNANFEAKYGFENIVYRAMTAVMSSHTSAGTIQQLTSKSFFFGGDEYPKAGTWSPYPVTDAFWCPYTMYNVLACDGPRFNLQYYGITG